VAPRSTWRLAAIALAAIWVITPALAALHGALESHSYCAEHGAFEHSADEPAGTSDAPPTLPLGDLGEADRLLAVTDRGGLADDHAACALGDTVLRDGVVFGTTALVAAAIDTFPTADAIAPLTVAAPIDILDLAPKSSPPA
jgi:hypothetical protein